MSLDLNSIFYLHIHINSFDKSIVEKLRLLDQLDEVEKKSIYNIIDMAIYNIKLKQTLSNALTL